MASATFAVSLGFRAGSEVSANRTATFVTSSGVLAQADPYASGGSFSRAAASAKSWLPGARVKLVDERGYITSPWLRFFTYVAEQRLGGINGPSMAEVETNVIETKAQAVNAATSAASVTQQSIANAEALQATVEVVQNNSLSGATAIPPVVRRPPSSSSMEP